MKLAALILALLSWGPAPIVQEFVLRNSLPIWAETIEVDQHLGITSVRMELTLRPGVVMWNEVLDLDPIRISAGVDAFLSTYTGYGHTADVGHAQAALVGPYDGTIDWAGPSGSIVRTLGDGSTVIFELDVSQFEGTDKVSLPIWGRGHAQSKIGGSGMFLGFFMMVNETRIKIVMEFK